MVAENEPFAKGAVLTLVETDKITNEIEAEGEGRFVRIVAEAGGTFPVGALLAVRTDGEEASADEIDAFVAGFRPADISFAPEGEETGEPPATEPSPAPPATPRTETNIPRSEEQRVGKECFSTFRSRRSPYHSKKQHITTIA